jgi:hypothetical protein
MGNVCIEKMDAADGILLGSPTYVADVPTRLEPARLIIYIRLADLLFGVHDEGAPCHDRFTERETRKEQNAQGRRSANDLHF